MAKVDASGYEFFIEHDSLWWDGPSRDLVLAGLRAVARWVGSLVS
jgi:hypothetical protein